MGKRSWKRMCVMSAMSVLLVGACRDDSSSGDASSDEGEATESQDATHTDGGGMCAGSSTVAECATYCAGVVAAACPGGPTTEECEQGCAMLNGAVGECPAWGVLAECAQAAPEFTCFMGEVVPEGCEEEFYCVSLCFG
jgi:hypothetical protein